MDNPKKASKYKGNMIKKYVLVVTIIVGCFILFSGIAVYAFLKPENEAIDYTKLAAEGEKLVDEVEKDEKDGFLKKMLAPPVKTNVLILCTDKSKTLSDVTIIASFDSEDVIVSLVNVPRDLNTKVISEVKSTVKEKADRNIPAEVKINELHSWAGPEWGPWAVKTQLEDTFEIEIDYTVRVDLEAFRNIVDLVGPIEMEIPAGGLHYWDPDQDLTINVPGGLQQLDGEMAEGVVRYRETYLNGDLQRIEVQQEFMKLLFAQALDKDNLTTNAVGIASTIFEYVETDFRLDNLHKYIPYIAKFNGDSLKTYTIPGEGKTIINSAGDNVSYFFYDEEKTKELIDEIFKIDEPEDSNENIEDNNENSNKTDEDNNESEKVIPKEGSLNIQVVNGGAEEEEVLAAIEMLNSAGYNASDGGKYEGKIKSYTRIVTKDVDLGRGFKEVFDGSIIELNAKLPEPHDLIIILAES